MSEPFQLRVTTTRLQDDERARSSNVTLPLAAEALRDQMTGFIETLAPVIASAAKAGDCDDWQLDEVNLSAEITGEGKLTILGVVSVGGGGKGGINFKFKRITPPPPASAPSPPASQA